MVRIFDVDMHGLRRKMRDEAAAEEFHESRRDALRCRFHEPRNPHAAGNDFRPVGKLETGVRAMQREEPAARRDEIGKGLRLAFRRHEIAGVEHDGGKPGEIGHIAEIGSTADPDAIILGHEVQQHEPGKIEIVVLAPGNEMNAYGLAHAALSRGMRKGSAPLHRAVARSESSKKARVAGQSVISSMWRPSAARQS